MLHLSSERLAALADDEPTVAEAHHLAACIVCARERGAQRGLLMVARQEHGRLAEPLTDWATLSERLRDEGLIATRAAPVAGRRAFRGRGWLRAAAAIMIAAGGVAAGRMSANVPVLPGALSERSAESVAADAAFGMTAVNDQAPEYTSSTDAVKAFLSAQREMQHAAAFLAEREQRYAPTVTPRTYRARLEATEAMVAVSRAALYEAPADPYINQYYLASLGARDAAIRQISRAIPPGAQLVAY